MTKKGAIGLLPMLILFIVIAVIMLAFTLRAGGEASSLLDREFCKFSRSGNDIRNDASLTTLEKCPQTLIKIEENRITLDGNIVDLTDRDENQKKESVNRLLANLFLGCWNTAPQESPRSGACYVCADIVIKNNEEYDLKTFLRTKELETDPERGVITYDDKIREREGLYYDSEFSYIGGTLSGNENSENYFIVIGKFKNLDNRGHTYTSSIIHSEEIFEKCNGLL